MHIDASATDCSETELRWQLDLLVSGILGVAAFGVRTCLDQPAARLAPAPRVGPLSCAIILQRDPLLPRRCTWRCATRTMRIGT